MNEETDMVSWKIRLAVQRLHKQYQRNPWIFMTEADIQCCLYSELLKGFLRARKTNTCDANDKKMHDQKYHVLTRPLHAELSSSKRKATEYVDLCIIDTSAVKFWIKKSKCNPENKKIPIWGYDWRPEDSVGVEIKFNFWITKTTVNSRKTKRERETDTWRTFCYYLRNDLKKLKRYKRGWLIFVDPHALIGNYKEWRSFVDKLIREANYGSAKRTLNAYCMSPKFKEALSYKSPTNAY